MPAPATPMPERILDMLREAGRPMVDTELFNCCRLKGWTMPRFAGMLADMTEMGILAREIRHEPLSINKTGYRDFTYYWIVDPRERPVIPSP